MNGVLLDNLHTLSGHFHAPVLFLHLGIELPKSSESFFLGFQYLPDEVLGQSDVVFADCKHGQQVLWIDGTKQIQIRSMLQELRGEPGVRSKEHRNLAVNVAGIQVGNGHRRRADGCFAIDLCVVPGSNFVIIATKPNSAYWETRIPVALGNTRFLQERQRAAAGTDKYEFRVDLRCFSRHLVAYRDIPASSRPRSRRPLQTLHSM